jgi:hypothetical protein
MYQLVGRRENCCRRVVRVPQAGEHNEPVHHERPGAEDDNESDEQRAEPLAGNQSHEANGRGVPPPCTSTVAAVHSCCELACARCALATARAITPALASIAGCVVVNVCQQALAVWGTWRVSSVRRTSQAASEAQ